MFVKQKTEYERGRVTGVQKWAMPIAMQNTGTARMFFFFKQKTAYEIRNCDWSSDVCSSDLKWVVPMVFCLGTEGSNDSLFRNGCFTWFSV